jgi:putative NADH-flavin reductase
MRVAIFGATGGTGRQLVSQALERGWTVTAFVRDPAGLPHLHERLAVVAGDARDPAAVERALAGHDAVLSALGVSRRTSITICSEGTRLIVEAMRRHGVRRLVCESAYGAGETRGRGPYARLLGVAIRARLADKERMEALVRASGLDWTIVRPPILTNGPRRAEVRAGTDLRLGMWPRISRADVAAFMLAQAASDDWLGRAVTSTS